ncbi:MAG: hypothetical protein GPJ54_21920 [Candidatus Heimdallarchaeota archaeon]|nr:hypothetical protein [Candidatus Heimdallarchaeota archaeon]
MKNNFAKFIGIFIMINLMISGVSSQEYVNDDDIYYSQKLKAGMEFTWEFVRFNFELNNTQGDSPALDQASTSTTAVTSSVIDETSTITITATTTSPVTSSDDVTVTETETVSDQEFPEIPPGSKYTLKLLKDLGDLSQEEYWDTYETDVNEYYDGSFNDPNLNDEEFFGGLDPFIFPSEIRFSNGTELNYFQYSIEERQRQMEEYSEDYTDDSPFGSEEYYIQDGIAIEKIDFSEENMTFIVEQRADIDTGVLLYLSLVQEFDELKVDLLIVLDQTEGIDIDTVIANDDPTLSVPISAIFVYTLILIPIIVNRIRKKN